MPGKGYATIGLKPSVLSRLHNITDKFYPGMFLPSTLIILMNEVNLGYYTIESHKMTIDLSGRYNTITIRSDVKNWLEQNFDTLHEEYERKYNVKCFANFISYFLANLFESKFNSQGNIIRLNKSDFDWLKKEYQKKRRNAKSVYDIPTFERFADSYLNEILQKIRTAKDILTI